MVAEGHRTRSLTRKEKGLSSNRSASYRMKFFLGLASAVLLSACAIPYQVHHTRYFTALRGKLRHAHSVAEMRAAIVEVIPLGLSRAEVQHRLRLHFNTAFETDAPKLTERWFPTANPRWSSICLTFDESGEFPWGFDAKEAHFLFDTEFRLRMVIVVSHSDWI
jgi:hypothetical protein